MGPALVNAIQTRGVPQPCRHGDAVSVADNNFMLATRFSGDQAESDDGTGCREIDPSQSP
jgi:hypothetical protein